MTHHSYMIVRKLRKVRIWCQLFWDNLEHLSQKSQFAHIVYLVFSGRLRLQFSVSRMWMSDRCALDPTYITRQKPVMNP